MISNLLSGYSTMTLIRILASLFWFQSSFATEPDKSNQPIIDKEFLYFLAYSVTQGDEIIDPLSIATQQKELNQTETEDESTVEKTNED